MSLSFEEQETIIRWDKKYKTVDVYTCDSALINRLNSACEKNPEYWTKKREDSEHGRVVSAEFVGASKKLISIRNKRLTNNMTPEQRKAAAEHLRKIRSDHMKEVRKEV